MLLFLYGPDTWRKAQKLKQITERFIREFDPARLNLVRLEASDADEETLRQALRASPFLARKRLVVLKNFLTGARRHELHELLEEILPALGEERTIAVSEDEDKPKKDKDWKNKTAKKVWEYLERQAQVEKFPQLWGAKLQAAIVAQAKEYGVEFAKDAVALLAVLSGGDLGYAAQEIEKLARYCGARAATAKDVKALCAAQGEASIFEFLDALGDQDQKTLLRTAEEQLQETDPLYLVSRVSVHLRAFLAMKLAGQAGAQALKLHPFQAKKISAQMRNWTPETLKRFLFGLMALEAAAKRGLAADVKTQLTALLVQAMRSSRAPMLRSG